MDDLVINSISKPVEAQIEVLHASMVLRILGDTDSGLVIKSL
jgi:hypothetical protein